MGRRPCCEREGVNRGAWTAEEDQILVDYVKAHGEGRWGSLPKRAGLNRCGKSCRMRWLNYLRPDIKRGNISPDEEELIIRLHRLLGNRWSLIAGRLPGRTDNEIKNYWNTILGKRAQTDAPKARHYPDRPEHKTNMKLQEDDTVGIPHSTTVQPSVSGEEPSVSPAAFWAEMLKCSEVDTITTQVSIQQDEHDNYCFGINHVDPVPYPPFDRDVPSKSEIVQVEDCEPAVGFLSGFHRADENAGEDPMMDFDFGDVFLSDLLNNELSLDPRPAVSSEEAMVQTRA